MATTTTVSPVQREPELLGQTIVVIGGSSGIGPVSVATRALMANLALELAPVRVNLIAAGFVDTALSASLLGDGLDARRERLRATLPIGRVVTRRTWPPWRSTPRRTPR